MTLNQLEVRETPAAPQEAERMIASMRGLLHSPIATMAKAAEISAAVRRLTIPAGRQWIAGRVAALLSQYYVSSVPPEMMEAIAEDWHEELQGLPAWAIQKACRWWMSEANEDRRKKPIAGDISARAKIEMGAVKLATSALGRFERGGVLPEASGRNVERCSGEAASEIMAQAGFTPKRFGGDA